MIGHFADTNTLNVADTLNTGVITIDIDVVDVLFPLIACDFTGDSKQTGTAGKNLFVIEQAFFNRGLKLQGLSAESGLGAIFNQPDGDLPKQYRRNHRHQEYHPGDPGIAQLQQLTEGKILFGHHRVRPIP